GGLAPKPMTTWKIDNAHTQISFSAKHMMVTNVRGTFHDVTGTIELDENDPTRSRGQFHVATSSVDTNFGARDATKPMTFDVRLEGIVKGMSGARHVGLTATGIVLRDDWGLNWNVALEQG